MTTQQLIPTHTGELAGTSQSLVNARDLYTFLGSRQEFANWIKNRIEEYGFTEGQDFLINSSKSLLGRPKTEYHLSLDMAKELAMVEKSARGRQARQYFIVCENRLRELALAEDALLDILEARIEQRLNTLEAELLAADPRLDKVRRCKLAGLSDLETARALQIGERGVRERCSACAASDFCRILVAPAPRASWISCREVRHEFPGTGPDGRDWHLLGGGERAAGAQHEPGDGAAG